MCMLKIQKKSLFKSRIIMINIYSHCFLLFSISKNISGLYGGCAIYISFILIKFDIKLMSDLILKQEKRHALWISQPWGPNDY